MLCFSDLVCFCIPLPASIVSKEPSKVYKRLLLVVRRIKLVYRLTYVGLHIGSPVPVSSSVGSPIPVGLPIGSSCSLCGLSQPSLPSIGPFCRPIEPVGPVKLSRGLFQPSLPLSRPSQPSLSPGNPLYPSCRSVKRSPPSVEPSQASLTPVKSS